MKISRPVIINTSLGVVIVAAIIGAVLFAMPKSATGTDSDTTQLTSTVQQGAVTSSITATGQISSLKDVDASFAVNGTIATVDVALGQTVAAGQQLGTLDATDLNTALSEAKADLSTARAQPNATTASITKAKNAVASAQADLASATLTASISGLVVAVNGQVGASAGASAAGDATAFVTIADVSAMTMTANIAEADIADVAIDQAATVTFPALPDVEADATVTAIAPTATASNSVVTYAATITLAAIPEGLRLGQTAEVTITIESSAEDALYVPSAAVATAADGTSTVDVVDDDGQVTTMTVTTGLIGDQGTEILTGLSLGQTIVLGEVSNDTTGTDTPTIGGFGGQGGFIPPEGFTPPAGGNFQGGPNQ